MNSNKHINGVCRRLEKKNNGLTINRQEKDRLTDHSRDVKEEGLTDRQTDMAFNNYAVGI